MRVPSKEMVARLNMGVVNETSAKLVLFQIAYDGELAAERGALLRSGGFEGLR